MNKLYFFIVFGMLLMGVGVKGVNYETNKDGDFDADIWDYVAWKGSGPKNGKLDGSWEINHRIFRNGDVTVTQAGNIYGTLTVNAGDFIGKSAFTIHSGAKLEIFGSLTASQKITINDGGELIVHDNTTLTTALIIKSGGKVDIKGSLTTSQAVNVNNGATLLIGTDLNITGSSSNLSGDVVVGGDVELKNTTVSNSGNFVVGGDLKVNNGGGSFSGDVYMLDPTAVFDSNKNNITESNVDSLEDLLNDPEDSKTFIDVIDDIVSAIPAEGWQGASDDWNDTNNWTSGKVPTIGNNVIITEGASSFPVTNTDGDKKYCMWKLTLEENTTLIIPEGSQVSVYGSVTIPASSELIIQNNEATPTTFICYGEVDGDITVEWSYTSNRYFYIGHATDVDYSKYSAATTSPFNFYQYSGSSWSKVTGFTGAESKLNGYAVMFKEDVTVSHKGAMNNSSYSYSLKQNNLLANPYQAYIDINSDGFSLPAEADMTVYTSTNASGGLEYATYNRITNQGVNGGTRYIAPGQGYWITGSGTGDFTLNPSARTHTFETGKRMLKSAVSEPSDVLRMTLSNGAYSDEIALVFRPEGMSELSSSDSRKRMSSGKESPNLYALKGNAKISIGLYPETHSVDVINLGYKFGESKELVLKATNIRSFNGGGNVYLIDKVEGITVDLNEEPEYVFIASGEEETDRFDIVFTPQVTTGIEDAKPTLLDSSVKVYCIQKKAKVVVTEELLLGEDRLIEVYDGTGQLIDQYELNNLTSEFELPRPNTLYIIKVSVDHSYYQQKVISGQ